MNSILVFTSALVLYYHTAGSNKVLFRNEVACQVEANKDHEPTVRGSGAEESTHIHAHSNSSVPRTEAFIRGS